MHFNLFIITTSVLILMNSNGIWASKRIKRNTDQLKLSNNIDSDFAVLKTQKRDDHEINLRNVQKNDALNQQSKENETRSYRRPPAPATIVQEKAVPITITHATRVLKLPKKLVMRNSAHHNPQLIQRFTSSNDDPILDYIFNTLDGAKPLFPNVQTTNSQIRGTYEVPHTRTIIYAPPVVLKQPMHQPKQMKNLMENALTSLLMEDTNEMAANGEVCPSHQKISSGFGNAGATGDVNAVSDDDKFDNSNADGNVIQFCSCHFIKRLKEKP